MHSIIRRTLVPAIAALVAACSGDVFAPAVPSHGTLTPHDASAGWGPATPNFNLEVVLGGDGFGLVKFRQPKDDEKIIYLDTWVRDLSPNTDYLLQRAVDTNLDGICTGSSWLTLGDGLNPLAITTDATGTGQAALWRDISAVATGLPFDITFRVIDAATSAVVLTSGCYRYVITQ
jgi:hypothetical protein